MVRTQKFISTACSCFHRISLSVFHSLMRKPQQLALKFQTKLGQHGHPKCASPWSLPSCLLVLPSAFPILILHSLHFSDL